MNILSFFAHPDDETLFAGGTLALLSRLGANVNYLCATRGEGGEVGEPPVCSQKELGQVREREMRCAVKALGGGQLTFLDYVDPLVGPEDELYPFAAELDTLAAQVAAKIRKYKIQAVITHGSNGEYGHPAHLLVHQASLAALELLASRGEDTPLMYTVQAAYPKNPKKRSMNHDDPAHLILDIKSVLEQKISAALCHRTQHALFVRRASQEVGRLLSVPEVLLDEESLHRARPPVNGKLNDAFANLLHSSGCVISG